MYRLRTYVNLRSRINTSNFSVFSVIVTNFRKVSSKVSYSRIIFSFLNSYKIVENVAFVDVPKRTLVIDPYSVDAVVFTLCALSKIG